MTNRIGIVPDVPVLREYQEIASLQILKALSHYGICYLAWEERTGKTYTALEGMYKMKNILNFSNDKAKVLVITTASARDNTWIDHKQYKDMEVEAISFNGTEKYSGTAKFVIIDESHNFLSQVPKHGKFAKHVHRIAKDAFIIYMSATPYANHLGQLYQQFSVSNKSVWSKYKNYYEWYKEYGTPTTKYIKGMNLNQYDVFTEDQKKRILDEVKPIMLYKTRADVGFTQHPEDKLHFMETCSKYKSIYNSFLKHKVIPNFYGGLSADNPSRVIHVLNMLEGGGVINDNGDPVWLTNDIYNFKVKYIKDNWEDDNNLVIMYYYKHEEIYLNGHFKKAKKLQATKYAESISLADKKNLVIFSQDWRPSKYIQRRARQCAIDREEPIKVNYLITPGGISERIYNSVALKGKMFNVNREYNSLTPID